VSVDGCVVHQPVEHRSRQHGVTGERLIPTAKRKVRGQHDRPALVTLGDHLKQQVRLIARQRQVADLVDDQQPIHRDRSMQCLLQSALALRGFQQQHQVGRCHEPCLDPGLCRQITQADGDMRFAHTGRPQQDHVLGPLDEAQSGELLDLRRRRADRKFEVELIQRLDRREARHARQHRAGPSPTGFQLAAQHCLQKVGE
jgi:hypothetical protein